MHHQLFCPLSKDKIGIVLSELLYLDQELETTATISRSEVNHFSEVSLSAEATTFVGFWTDEQLDGIGQAVSQSKIVNFRYANLATINRMMNLCVEAQSLRLTDCFLEIGTLELERSLRGLSLFRCNTVPSFSDSTIFESATVAGMGRMDRLVECKQGGTRLFLNNAVIDKLSCPMSEQHIWPVIWANECTFDTEFLMQVRCRSLILDGCTVTSLGSAPSGVLCPDTRIFSVHHGLETAFPIYKIIKMLPKLDTLILDGVYVGKRLEKAIDALPNLETLFLNGAKMVKRANPESPSN